MSVIRDEPALVLGLVQAAIAVAVGFGLDLSAEQVGLLVAFTAAVLSVVTRSQVTPWLPPDDDDGSAEQRERP